MAKNLCVLSLLLFLPSCIALFDDAGAYLCWDHKNERAQPFSYDSVSITMGALSFYTDPFGMNADYEEELTIDTRGGAYNITMTEETITLHYIQNTAHEKYKKASGEYMDYAQMTDNYFLSAHRYHVIIGNLYTYVFHKKTQKLEETMQHFPPLSRRSTRQSFTYIPGEPRLRTIKHGPVDPEELKKAFGGKKQGSHTSYACEEEALFKALIRQVLDILRFV